MRGKTYRRFSTEFELGVVEAYLAGEGSLKGLATKAGADHSLVRYWLKKNYAGELSLTCCVGRVGRDGAAHRRARVEGRSNEPFGTDHALEHGHRVGLNKV